MFGKIVGYFIQISMTTPNEDGVYSPSRINNTPVYKEFSSDSGTTIKVSYDNDGVSNSKDTTAYGNGLDCWYIATDRVSNKEETKGFFGNLFGGKVK